MHWGSIALGFAALAVLEGIVSRQGASARVGGVLASAGRAVHWFISPAVPGLKPSSPPMAATTAATTTTTASPTILSAPALSYYG
jgi:hypothetical protein